MGVGQKSSYSLRLEKHLRKCFLQTAKKYGKNGSDIVRLFMKAYIKKPDTFAEDIDTWMDSLMSSKQVQKKFSSLGEALECKGF